MPYLIRASALIGALLASSAAFAQDTTSAAAPPPSPDVDIGRDTITIGAGIADVPSYEGSNTNRLTPAAAARGSISGYNFSTRGTKLFVDIVRNDPGPVVDFQLGPVVSLNFNRTGSIKDRQVEALGKRKTAVELGGYVGIGKTGIITSAYDKLSASVSYVHDVTDIHHSYVITPQIDYGTPLSRKAYVGISADAVYAGNGYADTYFSVTPAGSLRSGLPVYNAGKGWKNYSVSGLAAYSLTGDLLHGLSLVGGVSYSRLLNDFGDSPVTSIAGKRDQWFGAIGLGYTF